MNLHFASDIKGKKKKTKLKCLWPALEPTQPPIQWISEALTAGVKRPVHEADHSPPSIAEVNNAWSYTSTPQYVFMVWCI